MLIVVDRTKDVFIKPKIRLPPIGEVSGKTARPESRLKPPKAAEAAATAKPVEAGEPATKKHYLAGHYGSGASKHLVSRFRYRCYSADKHIMTREERNLNIAINLAWAAVKIPIYAAGGLVAGFAAGYVLGYLIAATTAIPFEPMLTAATWGGALLGAAKYLWDCEPIPKLKELLTEPRICVGGAADVFTFNPFHRRKQPEGEK